MITFLEEDFLKYRAEVKRIRRKALKLKWSIIGHFLALGAFLTIDHIHEQIKDGERITLVDWMIFFFANLAIPFMFINLKTFIKRYKYIHPREGSKILNAFLLQSPCRFKISPQKHSKLTAQKLNPAKHNEIKGDSFVEISEEGYSIQISSILLKKGFRNVFKGAYIKLTFTKGINNRDIKAIELLCKKHSANDKKSEFKLINSALYIALPLDKKLFHVPFRTNDEMFDTFKAHLLIIDDFIEQTRILAK